MYMIWHDYQPVQAERSTVSSEACINHNLVYWFRQNPPPVSRESDEEYFVAGLVVGSLRRYSYLRCICNG
jgi:hypothetical protein